MCEPAASRTIKTRTRQASRPGHGHSLPPAGRLVQDRPERAPDPSAPPLLGRKPQRAVPVAGGPAEWRRSAAGCGSPALPAVVPPAGGARAGVGAGDGALEAVPRCPARGASAGSIAAAARHQSVPVAVSGRHHDGQRRGPAHDGEPQPLTPSSRLPQPSLRFFSQVMGALTGPEPAQGGPGPAGQPSRDQRAGGKRSPDRGPSPICTTMLWFARRELTGRLRLA